MRIVQLHAVFFKGDAISNVALGLDKINKEKGWISDLVADLFSDYPDVPVLASNDYAHDPFIARILYLASRFIRLDKKGYWLQNYMNSKNKYKPGLAKNLIESANIRIWHYGSFYTLFKYFHERDILFYHGITYPYLSYFSEFGLYSKNMLQATLDMEPFTIVQSNFIKESLVALGFKTESIHILPLFHKYSLPYTEKPHAEPCLVAWGRYALNKGIPELVRWANQSKIKVRIFGDNFQLKEFSDQYKEAQKANTEGYAILSGKVPDFEAELANANIYISNSYHEGFNLPLIEAEAHSMPVLARRGTAMDELVKDGYNGYLFDSVDELPELVDKIMHNYKQMSHNAWKHSQNYTYEKFKERYLRILDEYWKNVKHK
ncbi:MAG: glycosyltransferase family 4 protein [Hydrogenobaculum sp.]